MVAVVYSELIDSRLKPLKQGTDYKVVHKVFNTLEGVECFTLEVSFFFFF